MNLLLTCWVSACAVAVAGAQVRSGGVYSIQSETLDSAGGPSAAGVYSVRQTVRDLGGAGSGGAYSFFQGFSGQLGGGASGAGPAAFAAWQTVFFGGPGEPDAGPMEDPDHDGVPNLLEFAFNMPPFTASTALAAPGTTGGLPFVREEEVDGAVYLTMEVVQRKNAGLFQPQTSIGLGVWAPAGYSVMSGPVSVNSAYERVKLRLGTPVQPGDRVFYRMNAIIQ
ncbi:MAG: hypothetical protein JWL81_2410 [Verrucomicrobiales bacterium]|nr:hypothetical protein [Verrucomicrobiales bacterium]